MREWLVGGAVLEGPSGVLLVRNVRRDGSHDWSPPGGVIDAEDTDVIVGLTREVVEETGLIVTNWERKLYDIVATAPDMGWTLRVESWLAGSWTGELRLEDPDGIVDEARWVGHDACASHLDAGPPWVAQPVVEWLSERWVVPRTFEYLVEGTVQSDLVVTRL